MKLNKKFPFTQNKFLGYAKSGIGKISHNKNLGLETGSFRKIQINLHREVS
ncbi:MAG TPA: hypothetical protein VJ208_00660 [Candidatus Nanoarchaeia archaeon]|nr:hypothetical protein [Candidatus Nanoarchaeia archaeon]